MYFNLRNVFVKYGRFLLIYVLLYILESNPHWGFGDFLNGGKKKKEEEEDKLVRDSNPHLSFNHPLPPWRLIE
jgi:hypothetical protein